MAPGRMYPTVMQSPVDGYHRLATRSSARSCAPSRRVPARRLGASRPRTASSSAARAGPQDSPRVPARTAPCSPRPPPPPRQCADDERHAPAPAHLSDAPVSGTVLRASLRALSTALSSDVDMNSSINASAMFPQLRLTPARAAFARPGPHATAFPDVNALMQPSDSPRPRRPPLRSSLANGLPRCGGLFFTAAPVPPLTGATPETFLPPAPHKPALSRGETRGSQVPGPSSSCVPWSTTPPGAYRPSPISRCGRCCLQASQYLGHPETYFFRGYLPTAHSLACLRFAESVTVSVARLATGRAGSPLAGRVSHPLDDKQGFMKSSHTPILLDQPCLVALVS